MQRAYIAHLNFLFNLSFVRNVHENVNTFDVGWLYSKDSIVETSIA